MKILVDHAPERRHEHVSGGRNQERRDESRRGRHECLRHMR